MMEYAIGKVLRKKDKTAQIKVLFFSKKGYWSCSEIENKFPPQGKVFAFNFNFDFPTLKEKDIIRFSYVENSRDSVRDSDDRFVLPAKKEGGIAYKLPRILKEAEVTPDDIFNRRTVLEDRELCFFFRTLVTMRYICGPVWGNDLSPKSGKEVNAWRCEDNYDIITDPETNCTYLAVDSEEFMDKKPCHIVDCMSYVQLNDWLKGKLTNILPKETLKQIREKLNEVANNEKNILSKGNQKEKEELSQKRFERIVSIFRTIDLEWSHIQKLRTIPGFKEVVENIISANIEEVLEIEKIQVEEKRQEIRIELSKLEKELEIIKESYNTEKGKLTKELQKITTQVKGQQEQLDLLEGQYQTLKKRKDDLVETIKIQADIFGNSPSRNTLSSYPLESVTHDEDAVRVTEEIESEFCKRVNESLERQRGFMRSALRSLIGTDKLGFQTSDIRTGIFLANVFGNTVYQLCQPSPHWISFREFWEDSLQSIWESAHDKPDIWHFLLLENFNIALPECYGSPLWNILQKKIKNIPYASKSSYPSNLRVIVSFSPIESEDNSHLGLPTHIAESWKELNTSESWDDNDNWVKLTKDIEDGLVINQEYFIPVDL